MQHRSLNTNNLENYLKLLTQVPISYYEFDKSEIWVYAPVELYTGELHFTEIIFNLVVFLTLGNGKLIKYIRDNIKMEKLY